MKNLSLRIIFATSIMLALFGVTVKAVTTYKSIARFTSSTSEQDVLKMDNANGHIYATDLEATTFRFTPKAITTNTTLVVSDGNQLRVGSIAGNITITLPSAVTLGNGGIIDLQDVAGVLDATHALAINATSGNINGSASKAYSTAYGGLRFISDGTNYFCR